VLAVPDPDSFAVAAQARVVGIHLPMPGGHSTEVEVPAAVTEGPGMEPVTVAELEFDFHHRVSDPVPIAVADVPGEDPVVGRECRRGRGRGQEEQAEDGQAENQEVEVFHGVRFAKRTRGRVPQHPFP